MSMRTRLWLALVLMIFLLLGALFKAPAAWAASARTFDSMTDKELDELSASTLKDYTCVTSKLDTITDVDDRSVERIMNAYPPHIKMLRQQCRINLILIEKQLYSAGLNPEFIHNYSNVLREDVVYFALQEKIKQKKAQLAKELEEREEKKRDARNQPPSPGQGLRIPGLTAPSEDAADRQAPAR